MKKLSKMASLAFSISMLASAFDNGTTQVNDFSKSTRAKSNCSRLNPLTKRQKKVRRRNI